MSDALVQQSSAMADASVSKVCVVFDFLHSRIEQNWWKAAGVAEICCHPAVSRIVCLTSVDLAAVQAENSELPPGIVMMSGSDLQACTLLWANESAVLWHDSAAPVFSVDFLNRLLLECQPHTDAVVSVSDVTDTVKELDAEGFVQRTIPRDGMRQVRSPILLQKAVVDLVFARLTAQIRPATTSSVTKQIIELVDPQRLAVIPFR